MEVKTKTGCLWYCYKHMQGTIHAKRFLSNADINEAIQSPFVAEVRGPIEGTREDALNLFNTEVKPDEKKKE